MSSVSGSGGNQPPFPYLPKQGEAREKTSTSSSSSPASNDSATPSSLSSSPGGVPYTEAAEMKQAILSKRLQEETSISSSPSSSSVVPPAISRQINIINGVMQHGILTRSRASNLSIGIIESADKNIANPNALCINYITSAPGVRNSLVHPAKGGIPVVLERQNDPLREVQGETLLNELSERAHCSMLVVLKCDKVSDSDYDAKLELINADGSKCTGSQYNVFVSPSPDGCMETRANGTVLPSNIARVILPERMRSYQDRLNIPADKLVFVPSETMKIPYNVDNEIQANVTISCPYYTHVLTQIQKRDREIFTHMLRGPTNRELGSDNG